MLRTIFQFPCGIPIFFLAHLLCLFFSSQDLLELSFYKVCILLMVEGHTGTYSLITPVGPWKECVWLPITLHILILTCSYIYDKNENWIVIETKTQPKSKKKTRKKKNPRQHVDLSYQGNCYKYIYFRLIVLGHTQVIK